jgi:hypothetical protein
MWAMVYELNHGDHTALRAIPICPPHQNCVASGASAGSDQSVFGGLGLDRGAAPPPPPLPPNRGLHSSTFRLNLSALRWTGGALGVV